MAETVYQRLIRRADANFRRKSHRQWRGMRIDGEDVLRLAMIPHVVRMAKRADRHDRIQRRKRRKAARA